MSDTNDWIPTHFAGSPAFDNQPAAPREVSREATPRCNRCGWPLKERVEDGCVEGNCSQRPLPPIAAPTPHSDSLDLEAMVDDLIAAVGDCEQAGSADSDEVQANVKRLRAALLSRLETRGRWYRDAIRLLANAESENAALLSRLETLTRERDEAEAQAKRFYTGSERLSDALSVAESENARMVEEIKAWKLMADAQTYSEYTAACKALDAARASRTQSPDANREEK